MVENIENQLLTAIANAKMRSETLEIKDPEMVRIVMDEIDALVQRQAITPEVARTLRSLPTNKLVQCFDAVQVALRGHSARQTSDAAMKVKTTHTIFTKYLVFMFISVLVLGAFIVVGMSTGLFKKNRPLSESKLNTSQSFFSGCASGARCSEGICGNDICEKGEASSCTYPTSVSFEGLRHAVCCEWDCGEKDPRCTYRADERGYRLCHRE